MRKTIGAVNEPRLNILLLGPPRLELNGRPLDGLRRKNRALIYYLAAQNKPRTRDHLLNLFWPDHDRAAAQQILRTMLHDLRQSLDHALVIDDDTLSFASRTEIDVRRFETGLAAHGGDPATLPATLDLYRGGFLDGFALTDTPSFDDWVFAERERLQQLAIHGWIAARRALRIAARLGRRTGCPGPRPGLRSTSGRHPTRGITARLFERRSDRRDPADQSLCKLLDSEMGVPPMPETRVLYDSIITDTLASEPAPLPAANIQTAPRSSTSLAHELFFVGRANELRTMSEAGSTGKLILVQGEPGIGKTRLVREFIAAQPPALVLIGNADELEVGLPYQPMVEALRVLVTVPERSLLRAQLDLEPVWRSELSRLVPELLTEASTSTTSDESRMWQALYRLLASLAQRRRVVLFLDDLHWADASTLAWLGFLRQATPPGLLLVAANATDRAATHLATLVQTLHREQRLLNIEIKALDADDLRVLAERLEPARRGFSGELARAAHGRQSVLHDGIGALKRRRRTAGRGGGCDAQGHGDAGGGARNSRVHPAAHRRRLARLSDGARRVLDAAAVIGREFDANMVKSVSGLTEDAVLDVFDELHSAQLVRSCEGERFAFDHSLTMQVVLQKMTELRRLALHRRVAQSLEEIHRDHLDPMAGLDRAALGGGERAGACRFKRF